MFVKNSFKQIIITLNIVLVVQFLIFVPLISNVTI